jgi:hypothetical protein
VRFRAPLHQLNVRSISAPVRPSMATVRIAGNSQIILQSIGKANQGAGVL